MDKDTAFYLVFGILVGIILEIILIQSIRINELEIDVVRLTICHDNRIYPCV